MLVIMVSGKAESGKNFISKMIKDRLPKNKTVEIAFADYLKFLCSFYLNWDGLKDEKGRELLQYVGTDVCRAYDKYFFSAKVQEFLVLFERTWDYALITDWRFPDELKPIKRKFDTITVRVNRPEYENSLTDIQKSHESETALDNFKFDFTITNDSTVEEQVEKMMEEILNYGKKSDSKRSY